MMRNYRKKEKMEDAKDAVKMRGYSLFMLTE
jgi:hypothetical protein